MTEFARYYLDTLLRIRALAFALACVTVVVIQQFVPTVSLTPIIILLAVGVGLSFLVRPLQARFGERPPLHFLILYDLAVVIAVIFFSGGLKGGFALFYVLIIVLATLLLGSRWALLYAMLALIAFAVEVGLENAGIRAFRGDMPDVVEFITQLATLLVLVFLALVITGASSRLAEQWQSEKKEVEAARAEAERASQRWALISAVALRVQEAPAPQDIYKVIADELNGIDAFCLVLKWIEPYTVLGFEFISMNSQSLQLSQDVLNIKIDTLEIPLENYADVRQSFETRQPVYVSDTTPLAQLAAPVLPALVLRRMLQLWNAGRQIISPMMAGDQVFGFLCVCGNTLRENDVPMFATLTQQAALAVEKVRLLQVEQRRAAHLQLAGSIAAQVSATPDTAQLIERVVEQIGERFGYDVVSLLLLDAAWSDLELVATHTKLPDRRGVGARQSLEEGILGHVGRTGKTHLANDVRSDPYYLYSHALPDPIRSELAIPLHKENAVVGVLDLESAALYAFDPTDVVTLELLAEQIEIALAKAQALAAEQKRAAQLTLVGEIVAHAAALEEPDAMLQSMVELVQQRFGYHHVCVSLVDWTRRELELRAIAGANRVSYPMGGRWSLEQGLISLAATSQQTVISGDVLNDPRYMPDPDDNVARSELCVPLMRGADALGVLDIESSELNAFDASDIAAMETLANQIAAALEKARSLKREQRRATELALVSEIAARASSATDPDEILQTACALVRARFGYNRVAVMLLDPTTHELVLRGVSDAHPSVYPIGFRMSTETGMMGFAVETQQTFRSGNVQAEPHYFADQGDDKSRSELSVPLITSSGVLGVLDLQSVDYDAFDAQDVQAMETLARLLAVALEKARSLDAEARRAEELEAVRVLSFKLIAERDPDALLRAIVESAAELLKADGASLFIMDHVAQDLVVRVSSRLPYNYVGYRLQLGEGLAGRIAVSGEPLIIEDYSMWEGRASVFEGHPLNAVMGIPLKWQGRMLGVIILHRGKGLPRFVHDDMRLANLFAVQAASALENTRLLEAIQLQLRAQEILTHTSRAFLETVDSQTLLDHAAATGCALLDAESTTVFLLEDSGDLVARAHYGEKDGVALGARVAANLSSAPGKAYLTRQPQHWRVDERGVDEKMHSLPVPLGFRSGVSAPMLVGERVVGVLALSHRAERVYSGADLQALALLATQTAIALERADYFAKQQRRARDLNLLFESYRAATSTLEPRQVIARLLEQLVRALDVTSAYFVEVDLARGLITQTAEFFAEGATAAEKRITDRTREIATMPEIKWVLDRRPFVAQIDDPVLSDEMNDYLRASAAQTLLRVPLVAADELVGYLSLFETRAARRWTPEEIRFVQTMASQAAAAFMNARLYDAATTRTRELQALYEASQHVNARLDVKAICETSVNVLREILGYHHVSIYFVEGDHLQLQVQRGYEHVVERIELTHGVMARAAMTRQVSFLPEVAREPEFIEAIPNIQSEIAVPLLRGERVLGVLNVETVRGAEEDIQKERLTEADAQLLSTFANQLSAALENARLFQETQQRVTELGTLHAASQALSTELELDAVLARVAEQFVAALDVDSCTLLEWDRARSEMVVLFDYDPDPGARVAVGSKYPIETIPPYTTLLSGGKPEGFRVDDPELSPSIRREFERFAWKSELALPLLSKAQVVGVIELGDRRRIRVFSPEEIRLAESLASQAAVALENARLYQDAQKRLRETETLYGFARELGATLDIRELGTRALDAAAQLTPFDIGEVSLVQEADGSITPVAIRNHTTEPLRDPALRLGVGITGWVAQYGQTVRLGRVADDPRYLTMSPSVCSEICIPLRIGERTIGVLNLESEKSDAFDLQDEQLLTAFANQLAIAIENARLYEQTKHDAEVKAALLRELSHRVKNNLAAITSLLYMALDEPPTEREKTLNETLGRVQSMALAHALLARSEVARVNLIELGRQVINDTVRHLALPGARIEVAVSGDRAEIAARQTTTLALVLNELATNALRHGFNGSAHDMPGNLRMEVQSEGNQVRFKFEDNGKGLPPDFDASRASGLGLNLVQTLVEKDLHGHFRLERVGEWTQADVRFRLED